MLRMNIHNHKSYIYAQRKKLSFDKILYNRKIQIMFVINVIRFLS